MIRAVVVYAMSVSVDGYIAGRDGGFGWSFPSEELFRFHTEEVRLPAGPQPLRDDAAVGDGPSMRDGDDHAAFADAWSALPKVVFSRTLERVEGNARLATAPLPEELAAMLDATDKDVEIGGAGLAAAAIERGLVDELRMFRYPIVIGGGTPYLPPVTEDLPLALIETKAFDSGVIYERYRRSGPPSA
jgi:dihydrofolate reductase